MDDEGATIAGYPLVRALRRGAEREVWVAADASGGGVEVHRGLAGGDAVLAREAEAVLAVHHAHLVPILDVAVDGGAVLVRPLLPRDLAEWLVQRQAPAPGEAVTALAPIAAALGALHAAGAVAGGCAAGDVRLDGDGAPLLLAEGACIETSRPTEAWRASSEGMGADVAGWRQLASAVLEAAGTALPGDVESALERRDLEAAGAALLAAWPALPLELETAQAASPVARARLRQRERAVGLEAVWARLAVLAERLVEAGGPRAEAAAATAARALGSVRPRFWAVAGGGAVALVAAAALLWPAGPADADAPGTRAHPSTHTATSTGAESEMAGGADGGTADDAVGPAGAAAGEADREAPESPEASGAADGSSAAQTAAPGAASPSGDDDPVAAAAALLAEREACLDAGDAACLATLHEPGSPQLTVAEPWRMPDDGTLELVQRLGDAWLLRVVSQREPASVLVMSTEAGWTLRDAWSD